MYHTVKIPIIDQHTHRFLGVDIQTSLGSEIYVVTSGSFGDHPAGNITTMTLCKNVEFGKKVFPKAAFAVLDNAYADDIVDSVTSVSEAKQHSNDIDPLLKVGSFYLN